MVSTIALSLIFYVSCQPGKIIFGMITPNEDFDPADLAAAPDYHNLRYWASHPNKEDLADLRPADIPVAVDYMKNVDVFYLHPTTYYRGKYWNDPLDSLSGTAKNTRWNMVNNASIFNDAKLIAE